MYMLQVNPKKKFPEVVTLNYKKGDRAMLIKDEQGDFAICIGRWQIARRKKLQNNLGITLTKIEKNENVIIVSI